MIGEPGRRSEVELLGRLGAGELTPSSDLDLILLYDRPEDAGSSDGARSLDPVTWHVRFTQRLVAALTVPTRRGTLYQVDMRLRPTGNKSPAATQFAGFEAYHAGEAEIWEEMALTRARVVAGVSDTLYAAAPFPLRNVLELWLRVDLVLGRGLRDFGPLDMAFRSVREHRLWHPRGGPP